MSRISRYNFDREKYQSVIQGESIEESNEVLIVKHENEINEIIRKCNSNEKTWKDIKFLYKIIELIGIILLITLSLATLILSILFFRKYQLVFRYLNQNNFLSFSLFAKVHWFYLASESVATFIDLIRVFVTIKIFRIFTQEKRDRKIIENRSKRTDDYLLIYSENSITIKTINNLKCRVDLKTSLKKILKLLMKIEFFINLYYCLFLILPKILVGSYIQINLMQHFNQANLTLARDAVNKICFANKNVQDLFLSFNLRTLFMLKILAVVQKM